MRRNLAFIAYFSRFHLRECHSFKKSAKIGQASQIFSLDMVHVLKPGNLVGVALTNELFLAIG